MYITINLFRTPQMSNQVQKKNSTLAARVSSFQLLPHKKVPSTTVCSPLAPAFGATTQPYVRHLSPELPNFLHDSKWSYRSERAEPKKGLSLESFLKLEGAFTLLVGIKCWGFVPPQKMGQSACNYPVLLLSWAGFMGDEGMDMKPLLRPRLVACVF